MRKFLLTLFLGFVSLLGPMTSAHAHFEAEGYFSLDGVDGWLRRAWVNKETAIQDYTYSNHLGTSTVWVRVHGGGRPLTSDEVYFHATRTMEGKFTRVSEVFRGKSRRMAYTGARFKRAIGEKTEIRVVLGIGGDRSAYHLVSTTTIGDSGQDPAMSVLRSFRGFMPTFAPGTYEAISDISEGDKLSWLGSEFKTYGEVELIARPPGQGGALTPSQVLMPEDTLELLLSSDKFPKVRESCPAALESVDKICRDRGCSGGWGAGRCMDCPSWLPTVEREQWIASLRTRVAGACTQ